MPPPPAAAMTIVCFSSSHFIGRNSKMRFGLGEATTRRHLSPSALKAQPLSAASRSASAFSYTGPMNLVGLAKAGSLG